MDSIAINEPILIPKEPMIYKHQINQNESLTKLRMIRYVCKDHIPQKEVAKSFGCHRNTVSNIIRAFRTKYNSDEQEKILQSHMNNDELEQILGSMKNGSRRPHGNVRSACKEQEEAIKKFFYEEKIRIGVKSMKTHLTRKYSVPTAEIHDDLGLHTLTEGKLRGIYRRNNLRCKKVRTYNGERRYLYDYSSLACFEKMHIDVKHIADKHSLPQDVYDNFAKSSELPQYEWNVMDAKSRFRFMAYSKDICAEFGIRFLVTVVQYIRGVTNNHDIHIQVGMDNGSEFCAGSERKEEEFNRLLKTMNASIYTYNPGHDIRKNLIERSHRTDDEEWYIPRGMYMTDREKFLQEAEMYQYYWNFQRPHSGVEMHGRTPFEVVSRSGLQGCEKLLKFPTLLLDQQIGLLRETTRVIEFAEYAKSHPEKIAKSVICQKTKRDIESDFFLPNHAQNVLTYYPVLYNTRRA